MKKTLFIRALIFLLVLPAVSGRAQDFHLTHYDAAKIYLNPAMTGMFDGWYRIHANYRTQWSAVATKPFTTGALAWDMPIKRFGIGAELMNNRAGAGNYNVTNLMISGAYDLQFDKGNKHHVAVGFAGGFMQKSLAVSKLVFEEQYTTSNGGSFDPNLPNGETMGGNVSDFLLDVNAGALYYYARESARINPFLGVSAFHINRPAESFMGTDNVLPVRWVLHFGGRVNLNANWALQPRVLRLWQINDRETVFGLMANYYHQAYDASFIFGPTLRFSGPMTQQKADLLGPLQFDASALELGMKKGAFTYRVSYDLNVSSLNPYTNGRGGLEFSVIYVARKSTPVVNPNCPRL